VFQRYRNCDRLRQRRNLEPGLRSDQRHTDRGPRAISRFRRPRRLPVVSGLGSLRALRTAPGAKAAAVRRVALPEGGGQLRDAGAGGEDAGRVRGDVLAGGVHYLGSTENVKCRLAVSFGDLSATTLKSSNSFQRCACQIRCTFSISGESTTGGSALAHSPRIGEKPQP